MQIRSTARRALATVVGAAVAVAVFTACSGPQLVEIDTPDQVDGGFADETQSQLEAAVQFAMAASGSTGAIVGVWAPWSGSWVAGVGDADVDDTFRVADVTRAMTCDALYRLAADGTVKLDDPVKKHVASVAGLSDDITLEQLCDGTSGIGSYGTRLAGEFLSVPDRVWDANELAAYGVGAADPAVIGTAWRDSDAGYVLLGLALESASGKSAAELLNDEVFAPLGLLGTSLPGDAAATPGTSSLKGTVSLPGADGALNCAEPTDYTELSASMGFTNSGAVSTITDLGRYAQALATGALSGDADRFGQPLPVDASYPSWFTTTGGAFQGGSLIGQFGAIPGYLTSAFSDPATGMTVAVVLNNSAASDQVALDLSWELAAIASKAPAASGRTAPDAGLPWTAQQYHDAIAGLAVCPLPAA